MRKKIAIAVLGSIVVVAAVLTWSLRPRGLDSHDALRVGSHTVTITELQERSKSLEALYGVQVPTSPKKLGEYWRDLAKSVALGYVLDAAALKDRIVVSAQQAQSTLSDYITQHYGAGQTGADTFDTALGNMGTSRTKVLDEIHRQLIVSRLFDRVTAAAALPSEADIARAYAARGCELASGEQRTISNIVDASRVKAEQALQQLRAGMPFGTVARTLSEDTSSSAAGGEIGTLQKSQLEKSYGDAAFAAALKVPFGPVKTQHGWNVGEVTKIIPAGRPTLAQVHDSLRDVLLTERKSAVWQSWLTRQLRDAHVQYADKYRPTHPDDASASALPTSASPSPGGCRP